VILVDANLLLYAGIREYSQHASAAAWLEERMNGTQAVGLPWPSLLAFLRLAVNPRLHEFPPTLADAWRLVREWLDCDPVFVPVPGPRHHEILERLVLESCQQHRHVPDAHLAALAIEHGLILATHDRGFGRFEGLRWELPLGA
jgi:toxin-antitoxin system PIN domain toxin